MSRNVKIAVVIVAVAGVAIALLTSLAQGSQSSPLDAGLKKTADRMTAALTVPDSRYAAQATYFMAFQLFENDQRLALLKNMPRVSSPGQFEQVAIYETKTMPPASLLLRSTKEPLVMLDGALIADAAKGKSVFTTVHQGNIQFRAYVTPLHPPTTLAGQNTNEVLEVFEATQ